MKHLSSDEICQVLNDEASPEVRHYLEACRQCSAEVERMEAAIGGFRSSLEQWSARRPAPVAWVTTERHQPMRFALAAIALLILAAVPVVQSVLNRPSLADAARRDEALMDRIDAALARDVPASIAPAQGLISGSRESEEKQ